MKTVIALLLAASLGQAEDIKLNPDNTVVLRDVIEMENVADVQMALIKQVAKRGNKDYPIYLVLDSPGGSVFAGDILIQFTKKIKNLKTITIFAASMAAVTAESLPGERLITENGILMFHRAKGQFEGQFESGEVESQLDLWKQIIRTMENTVAKRVNLSIDAYKGKIVNEWWMYGQSAVDQKAMDKVVDIICTQELVESKQITLVETPFGDAEVHFSGCPLLRVPVAVK